MSRFEVRPLTLPEVIEVTPQRFGDHRGFFSEVWNELRFGESGIAAHFVQDNVSVSRKKGVLRGLHLQIPPAAQAKLVRVARGAIFDVAVDVRPSSPTFARWAGAVVSAEKWNQLFIPEGFAHGFVTLEDDTEVNYKVSAPYTPECERSIRWDDPAIGIEWPLEGPPVLSEKDRQAPLLADSDSGF